MTDQPTSLDLDEIRPLLGAHLPATNRLIRELAETVRDIREHQAQPGATPGDLYSGNLHGWMGERMAQVLTRLANAETRIAELEGPAVEARAALAALCYDLEDPGTAALGALYLISQATVGVEAPRDDAAAALAQHDAEVLRKAAQVLEETDRDDDAVNLLYLLADNTGRGEETHIVADDSDDPEHVDDCPGCEATPAA